MLWPFLFITLIENITFDIYFLNVMRNLTLIFWTIFQVLKTKGYVDVKQDDAYGDILILKLPKWDEICAADQ